MARQCPKRAEQAHNPPLPREFHAAELPHHPNARTIAALEQMQEEMEWLMAHPRIQQKTWVAKGKTWLPTLRMARQDLARDVTHQAEVSERHQELLLALERVGLHLEMRDAMRWGYRWFSGDLKGAYPTRGAALEAALRERLG